MKVKNYLVPFCAVAFLLSASNSFAEGEVAQGSRANKGELQSLNEQITSLSTQIVDRQQGLESDLQKLMDQRRAVLDLENKVKQMIAGQEDKLISQRIAIQEAEKQLDKQKERYLEQHRRLDDLRASLEGKSTVSGNSNVAKAE